MTDETQPGKAPASGKTPSAGKESPGTDRAARIAVTVFPLMVLVAGVLGFLWPDVFTPAAPSVTYLLGFIMFCMGLTLTLPDFSRVLKRPWAIGLGVLAQFVIMPLVGWLISLVLGLSPELAAGVILVGCAPGGTASNVVTYLAKGDVALSVSMTTISTLLAPFLTPLLTLWLAGALLDVPAGPMMLSIVQTVLLPVVAGLVVRLLLSKIVDTFMTVLPWLSTIAISAIVAIVVAGSADKIISAGLVVLVAVILHNGFGLLLGYLAARAARLDQKARRALAVEVGMQNSGLAASLAAAHFSPLAALPAAVFSVWHNLSGAIFAMIMGRRPITDDQSAETTSSHA